MILDPLNSKNNVTRSTFKVDQIKVLYLKKAAFTVAFSLLHQNYLCPYHSAIGKFEVCCILRRIFSVVNKILPQSSNLPKQDNSFFKNPL